MPTLFPFPLSPHIHALLLRVVKWKRKPPGLSRRGSEKAISRASLWSLSVAMRHLIVSQSLSRIRRVKCDQKKPTFARCTSTGRICDGYDTHENYRRTFSQERKSKETLIPTPSECGFLSSTQELLGPHYFRSRFSQQESDYFPSDFWETQILCAYHAEPNPLYGRLRHVSTELSKAIFIQRL